MTYFLPFIFSHLSPRLKVFFIAIFIILPLHTKAQSLNDQALKSPVFNQYFNEYYKGLADYDLEELRLELFETIEDILSAGSHLSTVSLDYKTEHIETDLLNHLHKLSCNQQAKSNNLAMLKLIAANSAANVGRDSQIKFSQAELGMLSGVSVRILERSLPFQVCKAVE